MEMRPKREAIKGDDGLWEITVTPPEWTGFSPSTIKLTDDQHERYLNWWQTGGLIQDWFPDLNSNEREILLSGIGNGEFDR